MNKNQNDIKNAEIIEERKNNKQSCSNKERHTGGVVFAFFMLFVGILLLLNNFKLLPWSIWSMIWKFWPFLLIILAMQMILGRSILAKIVIWLITSLIFLFIIIYCVLCTNLSIQNYIKEKFPWISNSLNINLAKESAVTQNFSLSSDKYKDVDDRNLEIEIGSGEYELSDKKAIDEHILINSEYTERLFDPKLESSFYNNKLDIKFTSWAVGFDIFPGIKSKHSIHLGENTLRTSISLDQGSGTGRVDLQSQVLNDFIIKLDSGSLDVLLSTDSIPQSDSYINVNSGLVEITIPKEVGLKINYNIKSGVFEIDGLPIQSDGVYESDGFKNFKTVWNMNMTMESGITKIKTE